MTNNKEYLADQIPLAGITHLDLARLMYPESKDPGHQLRIRTGMRGVQPDSHLREGRYVRAIYKQETALAILKKKTYTRKVPKVEAKRAG